MAPEPREHQWSTISTHHTAEGPVRYQRCRCGRWRTLQGAGIHTAVVAAPASSCRRLHAVG